MRRWGGKPHSSLLPRTSGRYPNAPRLVLHEARSASWPIARGPLGRAQPLLKLNACRHRWGRRLIDHGADEADVVVDRVIFDDGYNRCGDLQGLHSFKSCFDRIEKDLPPPGIVVDHTFAG